MNTFSTHHILSAQLGLGIVCAVLLFLLCFACVHLTKLVRLGWKYQKGTPKKSAPPAKKTEAQKPPAPADEPVYYIVERKKKMRSSYGEPKRIRFK